MPKNKIYLRHLVGQKAKRHHQRIPDGAAGDIL
jgi:hypothetical protein